MGSSTTSENTVNTSTDSANTVVTMVTTTDGEQHDDSLDLIDVPSELSPPIVNEVFNAASTIRVNTTSATPVTHQNDATILKEAMLQKCTIPVFSSIVASVTAAIQSDDDEKCSIPMTSNNNFNGLDSPGVPPPTPMLGLHQESRFTFPDQNRKIPTLPDLKTTDFFSQAVGGSMDEGQADATQPNLYSAISVAKENLQIQINKSTNNVINASIINDKKDHQQQQQSMTSSAKTSTVDNKFSTNTENISGTTNANATITNNKPNINVTTNPLDLPLNQEMNSQDSSTSNNLQGRNRSVGSFSVGSSNTFSRQSGSTKRAAQATIVVQQPSLSLDSPASTILLKSSDSISKTREESVKQLMDRTNMLTLEDIHDFEMRHGSPHHSRSQSVRASGSRSSGRPNYLCLPQQRSRVASMPNTGVEEEYYLLRHFSITGKGVVNRGDSLKSRRSRSNTSVASSNSSTEHLTASYPGSARNSAAGSLASSRESSASQGPAPYRVLMLGASSVGKSSLVSQFMTSEYLHAYDTSIDDESGEKTVSVLLAGDESELTFVDHPYSEMTPENCISSYEPHGYCIVYSTTDRASVRVAEEALQNLWRSDHIPARAVILVGNKVDLERSRLVSTEEGKSMAISYDCKFIETSVSFNHNVDELLVGLLTQIRLKLENPERSRDLYRRRSRRNRSRSPFGSCSETSSPKKFRGNRISTSLKVRNLLGKVWGRDSKSKSCENLHVL
ncbi:uncharacterized protein LOC106652602 [Trichogramma pretiosum]|uniref:uncharacterized protein LOC106652602 n=1 Tax=Trichogramma pretiosum TaxID=7493 RepID=UPI0006C95438|nr:uncharacterized protein LOC106652602 [Trichogramma pretiosum]XP_014227144.1 uncharacterized protein LOC106652602 [Trichogramma pretiosum]XP_014227145.1 uncharacterized protein LOC106652602 [Trichogramma pretiosum]XP_014227146.1 uncharacterized protein LOC106652602 [Trichogramma pretiosum]XP_023315435.1 uncharacterized protein LOC106652602 [Trichogramma pretiosum]XP_023315436.1 uncharacterized protein LOC106652602 [Trichogramma pretiosum]